jgi:hypothetical protein
MFGGGGIDEHFGGANDSAKTIGGVNLKCGK